jgi:hypothetical protein
MDQLEKNREYLNHFLRNGSVKIEGCLKEIETTLLEMAGAVKSFRESITTENNFVNHKIVVHTEHTEKEL